MALVRAAAFGRARAVSLRASLRETAACRHPVRSWQIIAAKLVEPVPDIRAATAALTSPQLHSKTVDQRLPRNVSSIVCRHAARAQHHYLRSSVVQMKSNGRITSRCRSDLPCRICGGVRSSHAGTAARRTEHAGEMQRERIVK